MNQPTNDTVRTDVLCMNQPTNDTEWTDVLCMNQPTNDTVRTDVLCMNQPTNDTEWTNQPMILNVFQPTYFCLLLQSAPGHSTRRCLKTKGLTQ